jgi:WD40 repeat protein
MSVFAQAQKLTNVLREELIVALTPMAAPRFAAHASLQSALSGIEAALRQVRLDGMADILQGLAQQLAAQLRSFAGVARSNDAERVLQALTPLNGTLDRLERQIRQAHKLYSQFASVATPVVALAQCPLQNVSVQMSSVWSCGVGSWSPDGELLAVAGARCVAVIERQSMEVVEVRELDENPVLVDALRWSPDSRYLAAVMTERARIELRAVHDADWLAAIDCGLYGVTDADWSPCARCVVSTASDRLRTIVWSLGVDASVPKVQFAECPALDKRSHRFSPNGDFAAHLERRAAADSLSIFECRSGRWHLAHYVSLDGLTLSVADVLWSFDSSQLAVVDTAARCALHIVDARTGLPIGAFTDPVASLRVARWAPNAHCLAVITSDGHLRLVSTRDGVVSVAGKRELPHYQPNCAPQLAFSPDARLLALAYDRRLLILDLGAPDSVHALEHSGAIVGVAWSSSALVLAVADGSSVLTLVNTLGQAMPVRTSLRRVDAVEWANRSIFACDTRHKEAQMLSIE